MLSLISHAGNGTQDLNCSGSATLRGAAAVDKSETPVSRQSKQIASKCAIASESGRARRSATQKQRPGGGAGTANRRGWGVGPEVAPPHSTPVGTKKKTQYRFTDLLL